MVHILWSLNGNLLNYLVEFCFVFHFKNCIFKLFVLNIIVKVNINIEAN